MNKENNKELNIKETFTPEVAIEITVFINLSFGNRGGGISVFPKQVQ